MRPAYIMVLLDPSRLLRHAW